MKMKERLIESFFVIVSCIFFSLAINLFVKPNGIVGGGVTGLSLVIYRFLPLTVGTIATILNIPIIILGLKIKSVTYVIRCLVATILLNFFIDLFDFLPTITTNSLMAAGYAGVFLGISVGINYRYNISSGGTELLAQLIKSKTHKLSLGKILTIIDSAIVLIGSFVIANPENVLLAVIMIFVCGKTSDLVITGFDISRMCYIITQKENEVVKALQKESQRGITKIDGIGMYSKSSYSVLMTVVSKKHFSNLRESIFLEDPNAFVIVNEVSEVYSKRYEV